MASTLRIPTTELTGLQGRLLKLVIRKKIGRVPTTSGCCGTTRPCSRT